MRIVSFTWEKEVHYYIVVVPALGFCLLLWGVANAVRRARYCMLVPARMRRRWRLKAFAKRRYGASQTFQLLHEVFADQASCEAYVRHIGAPVVLRRTDGLAAGQERYWPAAELERGFSRKVFAAKCFSGHFGVQEQLRCCRGSSRGARVLLPLTLTDRSMCS